MTVRRLGLFPIALTLFVGMVGWGRGPSVVLAQETRTWPDYKAPPISPRSAHPIRLELAQVLGAEEGEGPLMFGIIADGALDQAGRIYAIDPTEHRIAVFAPSGTFVKWIGRMGGGPGEMLSPSKLIIVGDTVIVYDSRLSRISFFSSNGTFRHSFQVAMPLLTSLAEGPDETLIVAVPRQSHRLVQIDRNGGVVRTLVPTPEIDASVAGNYLPEPGAVCLQPGGLLIYANSWTYEIAGIDPTSGNPKWVRSEDNEVIAPQKSTIPGVPGVMQRGALLGLECGPGLIVLAYFDRETSHIYYDFLDQEGRLISRMRFVRDTDSPYPGFLASLRGNTLLTFRTKPFPQLFLYQVLQ